MKRVAFAFLLVSAMFTLTCPLSHAETVLLHEFTGAVDGEQPYGQLIKEGSTFYGTTRRGGSFGWGTVYKVNTDGTGFTLLHEFRGNAGGDGSMPYCQLLLSGSTLYGTTMSGGPLDIGTVFKVNTDGTGYAVLHNFSGGGNDGRWPRCTPALSGSRLYGTTLKGGDSDSGVIFSLNTDGSGYAILHEFMGGGNDGKVVYGSLTLSGSTLYGMTVNGGDSDMGVVFKLETDGTGFALLREFAGGEADGKAPYGSLILLDTSLYGMTNSGGDADFGTIFKMNTDGSGFALLHEFAGGPDDGSYPYGSLTPSGSKLYGMTYSGGDSDAGILFQIQPSGEEYQTLHKFAPDPTAARKPHFGGPLVEAPYFYGTTYYGGALQKGVIFRLELPIAWDFEDGTTGDWCISEDMRLALMQNVPDPDEGSDVVELRSNTLDTWFCLAGPGGADLNEDKTVFQWKMKPNAFYYLYVEVETPAGTRWLYYTPGASDVYLTGAHIHHGLGYNTQYGIWRTFARNLAKDLDEAEPGNTITAVNRFCIRCTDMRVDDMTLQYAIPSDFDSDSDGIPDLDEIGIYGTDPYDADSDDDGLMEGAEATLWGGSWNANPDGDATVNLLDTDSDNDGFDDGTEVAAASNPADANSIPRVSFDWNDGGTGGWFVVSGLGAIRNVAGNGGRAIELRGTTSTMFSLKNADGTLWHNNVNTTATWDMKASAMYYLYVDLQTANGQRYLLYTPSDTDLGKSGEYLRFGLGVVSKNGTWQSHNRNLATDVSTAEPGNTILEVNQILYRGPGFFDNVELSGGLP